MGPLEEAIQRIGGQSALARAIGVKQAHVWYWLNRRGGEVPAKYVIAIEAATGVARERFLPQLFSREESTKPARPTVIYDESGHAFGEIV